MIATGSTAGRLVLLLLGLVLAREARADDGVRTAGDILAYGMPAAAAGLTLHRGDHRGTLQLAESVVTTIVVTQGLKHLIDERRPNGGDKSFPSGHSSIAFCAAEFLRKRYGWKHGIPAYAMACLVAYSRVHAREHYTRDVVAGATIGVAAGCIFTRPWKGWGVQAEARNGNYGVRLGRAW